MNVQWLAANDQTTEETVGGWAAPADETGQPERRVLVISYHFPPVGGAGVQRPLKFVKYLEPQGWTSSVLAAANPSVPVFDQSLCADIPRDTTLVHANTWEPAYGAKQRLSSPDVRNRHGMGSALKKQVRKLVHRCAGMLLQPDPQILWTPSAYRAGAALLSRVPHDVILATGPPYSNFVLGMLLKRRFGLPLVLDFRDEWDLSSKYLENSPHDWVSSAVQRRLQTAVLRAADAVVATTEASAERLREKIRQAGGHADAICIYNGFDADDFSSLVQTPSLPSDDRKRFRLVYTGTLWNLTNVQPLVRAVCELQTRNAQALQNLELVVVGRQTLAQRAMLDRLAGTDCRLVVQEYCTHDAALRWMAEADGLCLLLSDVDGADRVVPAKLFEYLALQTEILAILPEGEAASIVRRFWPGGHFLPSDTTGIAEWLCQMLSARESSTPKAFDESLLDPFRRDHQAGQLASLFDELSHGSSAAKQNQSKKPTATVLHADHSVLGN